MKLALIACAVAALSTLGTSAQAQSLYKIVGPDGRVTYTDRSPTQIEGRAVPVNRDGTVANESSLPFALRQVAARFPVTLYTSSDCGQPCELARALLSRRGIPYGERTASTNEEREAWSRMVGGSEVPTLQVGGQSLRGFTSTSWEETLDVAGYPRTSQLPANYQVSRAPLIPPRAAPAASQPKPEAPPPTESAPGGIRF